MSAEHPQFLKEKYNLHTAPEVDAAAERTEARTDERVPQDPASRIQNYLERFTGILERDDPKHRERGVEALKRVLHDKFVIKPENIPQSHFNLQGEIAVREGRQADLEQGGVEIENIVTTDANGQEKRIRNFHFPAELKEKEIGIVVANQTKSLDKWIEYLTSPDAQYPDWAKYWATRSVLEMGKLEKISSCRNCEEKLTKQEAAECQHCQENIESPESRKDSSRFQNRTKNTVVSFPPLNPRALAMTIGALQSRLGEQAKPKKRTPAG